MRLNQPNHSQTAVVQKFTSQLGQLVTRCSTWNTRHPYWSLILISFLAVIINCYPIIFCGKSYVSPSSVGYSLVYNWWPPMPGMGPSPEPGPNIMTGVHGSDVESMMWWGVPAGFIEAHSLMDHGELPLWNRYGHSGEPFIGQAVTMLGDPLQLIVILGHASAASWDIKYVGSKFLFCLGFGLLIWRLVGRHSLALLFTALAAYCGAYFFIYSHLVFFVLTYAPWILLSAMQWLDLPSKHPVRWGLIWLLSNLACFNAGHVEVAVVLIAGLNFAALVSALIGYQDILASLHVLYRLGVGTIFFLGLTAPIWISFLTSLQGAFTAHATIKVTQFSPHILPGVFDDLFYLLLRSDDGDAALAPGCSLLILSGCCLSVLNWKQMKRDIFFWVNGTAIVLWGGCIFGWVPNGLLAMIPLLNRVDHNGTDFSYLLILHLTIQSAYGFRSLILAKPFWRTAIDFACIGTVFAGMFALYLFRFWHRPIPWTYFLCAVTGAIGAPLLFVFVKDWRGIARGLGWIAILALGFMPNVRFGLYNFGNNELLMIPGPRVALDAHDKSIDKIKSDAVEPFRVVGLHSCTMGNYPAVYEFEDIRSCAPISDPDYMDLMQNFPGIQFTNFWKLTINEPMKAQPLLNLLNVKYLLTVPDVKIPPQIDFSVVDRDGFGVVENHEAWPRAFFTAQVISLPTTSDFIRYLVVHDQQPFVVMTDAEIEKHPAIAQLETTGQQSATPATNYRLLPNSTEFDIDAVSAGMVCLTEGKANDFTALVDGETKPVLIVNRAFKGVYLDKPGQYHIKFIYRPHFWRLSCTIFWISILGVIATVLIQSNHARSLIRTESNPVSEIT